MDTSRWTAWVALMAQSDALLVQLATMAMAAALYWEASRRLPQPRRGRVRDFFLVLLLGLYLYLMSSYSMPLAVAVGVGFGAWAFAEAIIAYRGAHRPQISTVENLTEETIE
jgi:hypothetical protein